jgi:hypothetical protein
LAASAEVGKLRHMGRNLDKNTKVNARRASRLRVECAVLISRLEAAWITELMDISASGMLIKRPRDWDGALGEEFVIDMVFDGDLLINLEATLRRETPEELGMSFSRVPANKERALWGLLGGYADRFDW